jgi:hypothetical protein
MEMVTGEALAIRAAQQVIGMMLGFGMVFNDLAGSGELPVSNDEPEAKRR